LFQTGHDEAVEFCNLQLLSEGGLSARADLFFLLFSLNSSALETECIAKGIVHKRYEFGCKVVLVTTSLSNWIVGIEAVHGNPYDGEMLNPVLNQTEQLTTVQPKQAVVDKGFRGLLYHPLGVEVLVCATRKLTRSLKCLLKRRCAIEPVIGHCKQDHALGRNFLRGSTGDRINALLVGCGFNLRKLFRCFLSHPGLESVTIA
jgi:IS5 family transposase